MHIGIVLYAASLIQKNLLSALIREYIESTNDLLIAIDYSLLLEEEQKVFDMITWYLLRKDKVA